MAGRSGIVNLSELNSNIEEINNKQTSLEQSISTTNTNLESESNKVGDLSSLTTSIKTSIVNAINSVLSALITHKSSSDHDSRYILKSS